MEKAQKGVCAGHCLQNGLESHTAMWGTLRGMERKACFSSCYAPTFGSGASFLKASVLTVEAMMGGPTSPLPPHSKNAVLPTAALIPIKQRTAVWMGV